MIVPESLHYYFFFFFQAEDGIRDSSVTGVQTCALPISLHLVLRHPADHRIDNIEGIVRTLRGTLPGIIVFPTSSDNLEDRSEERRVGKECRSRWSPYH